MKNIKELLEPEVVTTRRKKRVESEEKLSMTRELKFKELQEKIDEEESERIIKEAIKKTKKKDSEKRISSDLEKEIDALLEVENRKNKKKSLIKKEQLKELNELLDEKPKQTRKKIKKETVKVEDKIKINKITPDDDLYLTTSFQPLKQRFKLRKVFKVILKLIVIMLLLCSFTYFVVLPIFKMVNASKPKVIYDSSINYARDALNEFINRIYLEDDNTYKLDSEIVIDTNIKKYNELNEKKLLLNTGVDYKNNIYELGMFVEDSSNLQYGFNLINKNDNDYYQLSTSDYFMKDVYKLNDLEIINNLDKIDINGLTKEEYKYFINKTATTLKKVIKDEYLVASKEEIEVDGISSQVVRNSFKLDKERLKIFNRDISKILKKDDKYLKIEAKLYGKSLEEIKEKYETIKEYNDEYILTFNIYTINGNKFAGFDIEENGFRNIYYYKIKNKYELHLNITNNESCPKEGNCTSKKMTLIDLVGTTKDEITTINLYYNNNDIGSLKVKGLSEDKINIDFKVTYKGIMYDGGIILSYNHGKNEYLGTLSFKLLDEYVDLNYKIAYNKDALIGIVDDTKIIAYSEDTLNKENLVLENKLKENGLLDIYNISKSVLEEIIKPNKTIDSNNSKNEEG